MYLTKKLTKILKNEIVIPNLDKIASMVENDQPTKELQFFYGGQNKEFVQKLDQFGLKLLELQKKISSSNN